MNSQKLPKKFVFRPSKPQLCPHLYREIDGEKSDVFITWLPWYMGTQPVGSGRYVPELAGYLCSLSGAKNCNQCLSEIYKKYLSKHGFKLGRLHA